VNVDANAITFNYSKSVYDEFGALLTSGCTHAKQELSDCMWKLQAIHHHLKNVQILQNLQLKDLVNKSKSLEKGWLVLSGEPTPLLRFEFEAQLQQIYSVLEIAASGIVKTLGIGNTCSFRKLIKVLESHLKKGTDPSFINCFNKISSKLETAKNGPLSDFFENQSLRDRIVHFHCLRAKPLQVTRNNETKIIITVVTDEIITTASLDDRPNIQHKIRIEGRWSEWHTKEFVVYGLESDKWGEDDQIKEIGPYVKQEQKKDISQYSESLFLETKSLLTDLFRTAIEYSKEVNVKGNM